MQLLSRINSTRAVSQVSTIRGNKLASLPPELPPITLVKLLNDSSPAEPGPTNTASPAMLAEGSWLNISIKEQTVRTYGLVVVCLVAANVIISLALLAFVVLGCVRKGASRAQPMKAGSMTQYHPVESSLDDNYSYSAAYEKPED